MRRLTIGVATAAAAVLVATSAPAWGDYARPLPDPHQPGVAVGITTATGRPATGDSAGTCRFYPLDQSENPTLTAFFLRAHPGEPGAVYYFICGRPGDPGYPEVQLGWFPAAPPDPEILAREAARRLRLPVPRLGVNPPPDAARPPLVNLPVWLWVQPGSWQPQTATAWVPGMWARARATPVGVTFRPGDGSRVVCQGPGEPYTPQTARRRPRCGHTYTQPGRYELTATVTYQVSWSSPVGGGRLPPVTGASGAIEVPVGEIQALN